MDDDLKVKSDQLFKDLGTDTTTAIRMFLTQALAVNGFPFEIKKISANPYGALSEEGMYRDAYEVSSLLCVGIKNNFYVL